MSVAASWSWLDAVVVLVLVGYALSGLRAGLLVTVSALIGFVGAGWLALWGLPQLVQDRAWWQDWPALAQWVALLALALAVAVGGQGLGQWIGRRLRSSVRNRSGQALDALTGAVAALLTTALVLWFLAGAARVSGSPTLTVLAGRSAIIATIDRAMPIKVTSVIAGLGEVMTGHGFPQVFEGLGREPIPEAAPPDGAIGAAAPVTVAGASVVRVDGAAPQCRSRLEGSGWVVAPQRVVTNAHVVAGTDTLGVRVRGVRDALAAEVVAFDPERDLAVLHVPGLEAPALRRGPDLSAGDSAVVLGYPLAGPFTAEPARVRDRLSAHGLDIHGRATVVRDVYSLRTTVHPGNSGGPLVDPSGQVVGVIFARSLDDPQTGYALTMTELEAMLSEAGETATPVDTGTCLTAR